MNNEQQDLAWACLPKEERHKIISVYACKNDSNTPYNEGYRDALTQLYGHHNLTSPIEPEEMLIVERKKVQELHNQFIKYKQEESLKGDTDFYDGELNALNILFGDKCLPDKPSVQVEPEYKFSLGQKVILHFHGGEKGTISERLPPQEGNVWNCYKVKELPYHLWRENELELYTEPSKVEPKFKYNIGDKVILKRSSRPMLIRHRVGFKDYDNGYQITTLDTRYPQWVKESQLEPYTEPKTKETMEEKELNLCELLKGCEGEEFYSSAFGNIRLEEIQVNNLVFKEENNKVVDELFQTDSEGVHSINGTTIIFPSRTLYEKYPLDTYSAWMEWKEARKPRFEFEVYLSGYDNGVMMADIAVRKVFQFKTYEEIMQATEVVKEALQKFYEQNSEKQ